MESTPGDAARVVEGLRRLVHGLRVASHAAERELGLSGAQLFVLREIAAEPGASLRRLADRTLTDPSSVSVVAARLEARGLVRREKDPDDARRSALTLTRAGRAVLARAPEPYQARLIAALLRLPAADLAQLARALAELVDAALPSSAPAPLFFEPGPSRASQEPGPPRAPREPGPARHPGKGRRART